MTDLFAVEPQARNKRALLTFVLAALAVGAVASLVTAPNIDGWYHFLAKPSFDPPDWLFAPVWTILYVLMAVAAWRVWRVVGLSSASLKMYGVQLALNFAWSFLFFGFHRIGIAFAEIIALLCAVLVTGLLFYRRDRIAGLLFLPYIAWATFAATLNGAIWALNPGVNP